MANVILKNISKNFGDKKILKYINLDIVDGEFVVLVGASGCGKSTLLRMIAGLEKPTSGEILIDDKVVNNVAPKDRDIAFVFQNYALYPHLSVEDNISIGLKVRSIPKCEINERVKKASEILQLEEYLKAKPKELSGGQRQRVALARAIVRQPKVFLMDEPLSNLDAKLRSSMRSEIKKLHKKLNATFIYVTHDQTEALTMGDKIVVLNNGVIQQVDNSQNIYNNPKNTFVATFMGTNPMNLVPASVHNGFLRFGNITISLQSMGIVMEDASNILLGIRPEKIVASNDPQYHFNQIKFSTNIDFEENLGANKNVYFKIDEAKFCAVVDSKLITNQPIDFAINPKDLYFFNSETKEPIEIQKTF